MRLHSLMDVRFNMRATVLNRFATNNAPTNTTPVDDVAGGHWVTQQDDITGAFERVWVEDTAVAPPRNPGTNFQEHPEIVVGRFDIECYVRGFPEVGFRTSANTENWEDGIYRALESIQMVFPAKYVLARRQLVTNIRNRDDKILWLEEETGQPTVFEVQGITPTFDPFGRHIDNLTVLKRADIQ